MIRSLIAAICRIASMFWTALAGTGQKETAVQAEISPAEASPAMTFVYLPEGFRATRNAPPARNFKPRVARIVAGAAMPQFDRDDELVAGREWATERGLLRCMPKAVVLRVDVQVDGIWFAAGTRVSANEEDDLAELECGPEDVFNSGLPRLSAGHGFISRNPELFIVTGHPYEGLWNKRFRREVTAARAASKLCESRRPTRDDRGLRLVKLVELESSFGES